MVTISVISRMDWTHPLSGGAEKYLKEVLIRLSDSHDITLFCSKGKNLPDEETRHGIRIVRCGIRTDSTPQVNQTFIAARYYRERIPDDVLLVNGASQLYPLFRSRDRIDIYHLFRGRDSLNSSWRDVVGPGLEYLAMRLPKGHQITVSRNHKQKIERETGRSIDHIVNGGVDIEQFSTDIKASDRPMMLHLGRLGAQKGTDRAIEIHRELQNQMGVDINLHLCGTGGMSELAAEYADGSATTTYHGYVSEAKKVELMSKSWLQLVPSRWESFGLVVLEASAAGTPVVASDIVGLSETVKDGVNGVRVTNEEMVEACHKILTDEAYREELSRSAMEYARQYSWDNTAAEIQSLITEADQHC
jgi:glycosyltransferase involved in cell wall biosynthesis